MTIALRLGQNATSPTGRPAASTTAPPLARRSNLKPSRILRSIFPPNELCHSPPVSAMKPAATSSDVAPRPMATAKSLGWTSPDVWKGCWSTSALKRAMSVDGSRPASSAVRTVPSLVMSLTLSSAASSAVTTHPFRQGIALAVEPSSFKDHHALGHLFHNLPDAFRPISNLIH
jgi:hypothetical protein